MANSALTRDSNYSGYNKFYEMEELKQKEQQKKRTILKSSSTITPLFSTHIMYNFILLKKCTFLMQIMKNYPLLYTKY